MKKLIETYKSYRKKNYITSTSKKSYAFIGMGNHSINNLYPIINYFRLNLKYIVTKRSETAKLINDNFPNSIGTSDLDLVLNDDEISGVFICTNPSSHYELVLKSLKAGKNVFVEKPPCTTLEELNTLIQLEKTSTAQCMVGFQKRYAPLNKHLLNKVSKATYNYRFVTGNYPEGDAVLDLFIHPISFINYLFGTVKSLNIIHRKSKLSLNVFLQLIHDDGAIGSVELSTDYLWQSATEKLIINTKNYIYETSNFENLVQISKTGSIGGIPKEKIINSYSKLVALENRNNFNPILQNNQLYSNGYFSEIQNFIQICEKNNGINNSTLVDCVDTFHVLTKIKQNI